ncbi:hypothetical protein K435DRAFT_801128 [Dendrothele bispora CBS 962.96]|uniref:Uncharacterized protein n=1 Tax=Dendrothele bispora (strain CBS 962.96) TaxID=1314807 RepID=A0A4S8LQ86_DENBC|nr:hypothetical protein K435DRAFT_801128 [Dendrothele bispora CBS 962.96]
MIVSRACIATQAAVNFLLASPQKPLVGSQQRRNNTCLKRRRGDNVILFNAAGCESAPRPFVSPVTDPDDSTFYEQNKALYEPDTTVGLGQHMEWNSMGRLVKGYSLGQDR